MRTLDEVIEIASDWTNGFDEMSIEKQMLHYLKMYRSDQIQWEADREDWRGKWESYIEARERHLDAVKELKRNDPLTWDELKSMEGKPVYLEQYWYPMEDETGVTEDEVGVDKYWAVIDNVQAKRIHFVGKRLIMGMTKSDLNPNVNGGWQAYRKERS